MDVIAWKQVLFVWSAWDTGKNFCENNTERQKCDGVDQPPVLGSEEPGLITYHLHSYRKVT